MKNYKLNEKQQALLNKMLSFMNNNYSHGELSSISMPSYVLHFEGFVNGRLRILVKNKENEPLAFATVDEDGSFPEVSGIEFARRVSGSINYLTGVANEIQIPNFTICNIMAPVIGKYCLGLIDLSIDKPSYFVEYTRDVPSLIHISEMEKEFLERTNSRKTMNLEDDGETEAPANAERTKV